MARQQMAAALLALAALAALMGTAQAVQGLTSPTNQQNGCNTRFNQTLQTYYVSKNDSACANLLFTAFNLTTPSQCPPTTKGSAVHLCMNKNGTQPATTDAWADLIRSCEYMYIANRQGSSESESGFTYNQDSCFQRFNSWSDFSSWLYDASPYGGSAGAGSPGGASTVARVAVSVLFGAVLLALALVW